MKAMEFVRWRHQTPVSGDLKNYLEQIGNNPLLTREEEIDLAKRIEQGDESARNELVARNLRLVFPIANYYCKHCPWLWKDVVQDGNIGLIRAAEKFDWRKGCKFSTYATWWIRQNIIRELHRHFTGRKLPDGIAADIQRIRKAKAIIYQKLGREPTDYEMAKQLNITVSRQRKISSIPLSEISLDRPLGTDDEMRLGDLIASSERTPEEIATDNVLLDKFRELLKVSYSPKYQDVLQKRIFEEKTLEEIGDFWGVTKEDIRQAQVRGIRKLRQTPLIRELVSY